MAAADLDPEVRRDLLTLDKSNANTVARHLVMVSRLLEDDPVLALAHARAARERAARVGVVRETAGIAAYNSGEWQEAITELRAARRITGSTALLPLVADAERGLGRPERAIEIARGDEGRALTGEEGIEMRIVEAGARLDLGEPQKALVTLQALDLNPGQVGTSAARLFYAYASALEAAGRQDDAMTWFMNAASADIDDVTDAEFRLNELSLTDEERAELAAREESEAPVAQDPVAQDPVTPEVPATDTAAVAEPGADHPNSAVPVPDSSASDAAVPESAPSESAVSETAESPTSGADTSDPSVSETVDSAADPTPVSAPDGRDARDTPAGDVDAQETPATADETDGEPFADAYDALLLDLDGTVFAGQRALPHAVDSLARLRVPQYFVTNNASRRPDQVAAHLAALGFEAAPEQVVTSAQSGARLLSEHLEPGSRALVIGTDGLAQEVREVGIGVTRSAADRPAAVIQGHSPETDWAALSEAALAIRAGALWVATNVDATLPSERGLLVGNGSMVAALVNATGKEPLVAGKPAAPLMADAIARAKTTRPLVVGDRLDTDIEGAHAVGIESALVLTGVSDARDLVVAPPEQRPTFVIDDLSGLFGDRERARITAQPGWDVTISGSRARVERSADAADAALLPAVAAAYWAAIDEGAEVDETAVAVETVDPAARSKLAELGIGPVG